MPFCGAFFFSKTVFSRFLDFLDVTRASSTPPAEENYSDDFSFLQNPFILSRS